MRKSLRYFRPALLAALVFVFCGAAFADDIHVTFDPVPIPVGNFGVITDPTAIYSFSFINCTSVGIPSEFAGDDGCIALINETGVALPSLTLSFVVNSALVGQTISCESLDGNLTSNNCASVPAPFTLGQPVSVQFFGGTAIPNDSLLVFGETGVAFQDAPVFDVTAAVTAPEPSAAAFMLLGVGLLFGMRKLIGQGLPHAC